MSTRRHHDMRVLRLDVSETPPRWVFVPRTEAARYFGAYVKPPGAEVLKPIEFTRPPWLNWRGKP